MAEIDMHKLVKAESWETRDTIIFGERVYLPWHDGWVLAPRKTKGGIQEFNLFVFDMLKAYENAEFYRKAVLDETIPLWGYNYSLFDEQFGRVLMIDALGHIKYKPACPELREAMLQDVESEIRETAAKSLGRIREKKYISDFIFTLTHDKNRCVREATIEALGDYKNPRALVPLRDRFEELLFQIRLKKHSTKLPFEGAPEILRYGHEYMEFKTVLNSICKIGGPIAEETLERAIHDSNPHISGSAKSCSFGTELSYKFWGKKIVPIKNNQQYQKELQKHEQAASSK